MSHFAQTGSMRRPSVFANNNNNNNKRSTSLVRPDLAAGSSSDGDGASFRDEGSNAADLLSLSRHSSTFHRTSLRQTDSIHHREGRRDFNFLLDDPKTMTVGRRIALSLMKYQWYYPRAKHFQITKNGTELPVGGDSNNNIDMSRRTNSDEGLEISNAAGSQKTYLKASLAKAWAVSLILFHCV